MKLNVYEIITEKIISLLSQGVIPWSKPWKPEAGEHMNLVSGKPYRGINVFLLGCAGYDSPFWLSFKQAKKLGGSVKKGEQGSIVVFWKWIIKEEIEDNGEKKYKKIPLLRYYTVFNLEQCEGIDAPAPVLEPVEKKNPIKEAQTIVDGMPNRPAIVHGGNAAAYSPAPDRIKMPELEQFVSSEEYYSTLFHEMTHSTGHASRIGRKDIEHVKPFGSVEYSKEELIAEMGAAFLCAVAGIENKTINNSAAYIQGWLKELKNDKKMVVFAAAAAQKAADYIQGIETYNTETVPNQEQGKSAA